jgi:hypothetical protein
LLRTMQARVIAIALAFAAAAGASASRQATPRPIAFTCKIEKGVAVVVDPRRRQTTVIDARRTGDQYGNPVQSQESNRLVAILTPRGVSYFGGCKRVTPRRTRTANLVGPWPARVFSRVLCGFGGPTVRFDAFPVSGGGYRLTIAPQDARSQLAAVSTTQRTRNRGGISFDLDLCIRVGT